MKTFQEFLEEGKKKRDKEEYKREYKAVKKEVKAQKGNTQIHYGGEHLKPGSPGLQARLDYMEKHTKKGLRKMQKAFQQSQNG